MIFCLALGGGGTPKTSGPPSQGDTEREDLSNCRALPGSHFEQPGQGGLFAGTLPSSGRHRPPDPTARHHSISAVVCYEMSKRLKEAESKKAA